MTKHCIEKEKIPLNYNSSEYDGAAILSAQAPASTRLSIPAWFSSSSTNKNLPSLPKDFPCSIWFVKNSCQQMRRSSLILVEYHAVGYSHSVVFVFMVVIVITYESGLILMMSAHTDAVIDVKIVIHRIVVLVASLNV